MNTLNIETPREVSVGTILVTIAIVGMLLAIGVGIYKGQTEPSYSERCRAAGGVPVYMGTAQNCAMEGFIDLYK
jgi:hypothetical protein